LYYLSIKIILLISIASVFAFLLGQPIVQQQQSAYTASPKTSDLKQDVKQSVNQDNLCHRADDCNQANEGQGITGKDNTASGFNDQSNTNTSSLLFNPAVSSFGAQANLVHPVMKAHPVLSERQD
jgi:hypothetical protein